MRVCKLWYKIIINPPVGWEDTYEVFGQKIDVCNGLEMYELLCLPVHRYIFIGIEYRYIRAMIVHSCIVELKSFNKLGNEITDHHSPTSILHLTKAAVIRLCSIVDSDLMKHLFFVPNMSNGQKIITK